MNNVDNFDNRFDRWEFLGILKVLCSSFSDWVYDTLDFWYFSPVKWVNDNIKYPLIIFIHWIWHWARQRSQINDSYFPYMAWKSMQRKFNAWWAHILLPRIPKSNFLYKKKLLQWLIDDYIEKNQKNIDMNEIFIMGSSAGGAMAWNLMVDSPDLYKKALITCAPKIPAKNEIKKLQDKPIWMVAAKKDPIVPFLSQKLARSKLKENTIVPEQCRLTIFPWDVYSPDWLHIAIPHLLAKVITTDFIPLSVPKYENLKYTWEDYPWAYTISATGERVPTKWIIDWLKNNNSILL